MEKNNLVIINNEKIFEENNNYYCDNLDLKVLPEGLSEYHEVNYIVRTSKKKGGQKINLKNINAASNIFKFIFFILRSLKKTNTNYLLISITPYTFTAFIVLFFARKKTVVYLMSSGHEEYKYILGNWAVWIYHLMYKLVTLNSKVIVCHERLHKKSKSHIIYPSQLDDSWLANYKKPLLDKIKFLYVGRLNPEKGIYDFLEMFEKIELKAELTIPGLVQTIVLSRTGGRTGTPERERLENLASLKASLCLYLSARHVQEVQENLLKYYEADTPVALGYRVSWEDEWLKIVPLCQMAAVSKERGLIRTTLYIVSPALKKSKNRSKLYTPEHSHLFRKSIKNIQ